MREVVDLFEVIEKPRAFYGIAQTGWATDLALEMGLDGDFPEESIE